MKFKKNYYFILFLFLTMAIQSQDINNRWAIGIGAGGVLYSEKDGPTIGYRYSEQFPRLSLSRYMFKNVTFVGALSTSIDPNRNYTTLDGEARYDFGTSQNKLSPYILIGASIIDHKYIFPVINFGAGGTLWVSDRIGLNGQLMYKYNYLGLKSQGSHLYGFGTVVYRFSLGKEVSRTRKGQGSRSRLWDR
jgi:hypothetical protein